jgi:hypothetical protein
MEDAGEEGSPFLIDTGLEGIEQLGCNRFFPLPAGHVASMPLHDITPTTMVCYFSKDGESSLPQW